MSILQTKPRLFDSPHGMLALGLAGISLGQALQNGNGFINVTALFYLTLALMFLGWVLFGRPLLGERFFAKMTFPILTLGLLLQIYQLAFAYFGDGNFLSLLPTLWQFRLAILLAGGLAMASLAPSRWVAPAVQNALTIFVLVALWYAGTWLIKSIPYPFIDVFVFQQNSSKALLDGRNPYLLVAPYIYGDLSGYSPELVRGTWFTFGSPYPPLSIYLSSLGYFFEGDVRYAHLLAFLLSGVLIAFMQPGRMPKLAAYLFLFMSRSFYVLEMSWTEPFVVLLLVATIYCALHHPRWLVIPAGLFLVSKQYILFIAPLLFMPLPLNAAWWRRFVQIGLVGFFVTAPLAFWNVPAFIWNVVSVHLKQSFRLDALTYLAAYARVVETEPSQWFGFVVLLVSFLLVWRFFPRTPAGFAAAVAWCLLIFFAFSKQAFCNYYFLVIGAIACALSLIAPQNVP